MSYRRQNYNKADNPFLLAHKYSGATRAAPAARASGAQRADETIFQKRNRNLEELSEELERCTRETQELQREVERASMLTLERIGGSPGAGPIMTHPLNENHTSFQVGQVPLTCLSRGLREDPLEQYSRQALALQRQLSETHKLHEKQVLRLQRAVDRLQAQLQQAHTERETASDWSALGAHRQAEAWEDFCRKQESLERALREVGAVLSAHAERRGRPPFVMPAPDEASQLAVTTETVLLDLEAENASLQARLQPLEEQLEALRAEEQEQAEHLAKEMEGRKQAEAQCSVYQTQICESETALSAVQAQLLEAQQALSDQKEALEQQLAEAQDHVEEAQGIRERSIQQVQEQDSRLCQLTVELHQAQEELNLQREQNWQLIEQDTTHATAIDALRQELDRHHLETQRLEAQVTYFRQEHWHQVELQAEAAALRLKLEDQEGVVKRLQWQMDAHTQLLEQQDCSQDSMQTNRSYMSNRVNQHKLEVGQLKTCLEVQEARAVALERELYEVQASLRDMAHSLEKIVLERRQLADELKVQSMQLSAITEEQAALKQSLGTQQAGLENANVHLRAQLQAACKDLDQTKRALKATDSADRRGLKVAAAMQRHVTAKRQQVDVLQGRVQLLEETVDRLSQENQAWVAKDQKHSRRLASVNAERKHLEAKVEALRSLETQLRDRAEGLESALDKMSKRLGECQGIVQQQEQELALQKLQHALDLRELQNLHPAGDPQQSGPQMSSHLQMRPGHQKNPVQSEDDPTLEFYLLVQEVNGLMEDNRPSPHRQSAPEKLCPSGLEGHTMHADGFYKRGTLHSHTCTPQQVTSLSQKRELQLDLGRTSPVYALLTSSPHPDAQTKNVAH